jgi:hypothetical protein
LRRYWFRAALPLLSLLLLGCGVSFGSDFDGTETFRSLELSGERVAGSELTVNVVVAQAYSVPVMIACYYEENSKLTDDQKKVTFEERARRFAEVVLPPAPGRLPTEKPQPQTFSFSFSVPAPGKYFLACLTPGSAENGIGMSFTVKS